MDLSQPLALVLVAAIGVLGGWITNLIANRAKKDSDATALLGTIKTAQTAAEENAYQRAKSYYEGVIADQDKRLAARDTRDRERDVREHELEARVADLEGQVQSLTAELETAKNALRLKFPDE